MSISADRSKELEEYFSDETNAEDTQEWRDTLTSEEAELILKWDKQYAQGITTLCEEIIKINRSRE